MTSNSTPDVRGGRSRHPGFDPTRAARDPAFEDPAVRGAAVDARRMTAAELRRRFQQPPRWSPELAGDDRAAEDGGVPRAAAVLVPLVLRDAGVTVLLTERTAHLHDHAGQISFPGGRVEDTDPDPVSAALRESEEEIGLARARVEVLGHLPVYLTVTGFEVTPVVGLVAPGFALAPDPFEVAEVFEVPLAFLMDPAHHERRLIQAAEGTRRFYAMPYTANRTFFIWGATAAMLRNLYLFLRA